MAAYTIDDPSVHFQNVIWTGDGSSSDRNIINDGNSNLRPDCILGVCRSHVQHRHMYDSSRGLVANGEILPNSNNIEGDTSAVNSGGYGFLGPALSDGFESSVGSVNNGYWNVNARTYLAHQWKCNGGTTSTNTDGDINSTVQVNNDAGFSIVVYTPSNNTARNIGHGLNGAPSVIWTKSLTRVDDWRVWSDQLYANQDGSFILNSSAAHNNNAVLHTGATSTTFGVGTDLSVNGGYQYVSYCWREIKGYSKFGRYAGNSAADGSFQYCGFKPAWVMIKRQTNSSYWSVYDNKSQPRNMLVQIYKMNETEEQDTNNQFNLDFYSNGFKCRTNNGNINATEGYFYMAFAERPFTTSTGIPTCAR